MLSGTLREGEAVNCLDEKGCVGGEDKIRSVKEVAVTESGARLSRIIIYGVHIVCFGLSLGWNEMKR